MDSTLIAGILTAIATILAVIIGYYLQRPKIQPELLRKDLADNQQLIEPNEALDDYDQRYLDYPSHYRFVKGLPQLYLAVCKNAQEGWDTGITGDMRQASYDVIDFLEYVWLRLAKFYPENHWDGKTAQAYIQNYLQERFIFHRSKHEPNGPGTGGTIVYILTGSDVIRDLEELINDTVDSLFMYNDDFDLEAWRKEWRKTITNIQQEN